MRQIIRYSLAALAALTSGLTAWHMLRLHAQNELWGHWPLLLFFSGWIAILMLAFPRSLQNPQAPRRLALATGTGVLLALGFPPLPTTPLLFFAFVPLFLLTREIIADKEERPLRTVLLYGYHAFVIWNILTTYWVANTAFVAGIVAIFLNAFFMAIPLMLSAATIRRMPRFGFIIFASYWLSFEYLHLNWQISWPWLNLGNAFSRFPEWVQWYEYTGTFGGTLWILLTNLLFYRFLERRMQTGAPARVAPFLLSAGALIFLPILGSLFWYNRVPPPTGEPVEVVVVQPNFEPHHQKFDVPESEQLDVFLELSRTHLTSETKYLVFPETSFGPIEDRRLGNERITRQLQEFTDAHPGLHLVSGLTVYHVFAENEPRTPAVRRMERGNDQVMEYEMLNAAVQFSSADTVPVYRKSKLVPGAEFLPYRRLFFFLKPLVEKLEGSLAGYGLQERRSVLTSTDGSVRVGPAICYESAYGEYYTGYVRAGANTTFIMTNDGWWDNTAGHRQHLMLASLRAIETRKPIARSANTGISAFINTRGDILQPTEYGETTAIRGTITPSDTITFYVRWGDLIGRVSVFLTIILLLNTFVRRLVPPDKSA